MKQCLLKDDRGFTLIELLVAMTILAIGLLSIAGMQVIALKTNSSANTMTTNAALAEGILEEILSWSLGDGRLIVDATDEPWVFDSSTDATMATTTAAMNSFASNAGGSYTAAYSVDVNYNGITNVTRIEVTVTQTDGGGRILTLVGFKRAV
jgi:type IV pilus assembly protein PilV